MSEAAPKKTKLDLTFASLLSDDDAQVLTALTRIEDQGDARAIRPLLTALAKSKDAKVQQRITALLNQIKVKDAVPELIEALREPTLLDVRRTVLATFWNAGLASAAVRDLIAENPVGARTIFAEVFQDNPASARVLRKAGFRPTGEMRACFSRARGKTVPAAIHAIELGEPGSCDGGDDGVPAMRAA
jgi:hypothetical protein